MTYALYYYIANILYLIFSFPLPRPSFSSSASVLPSSLLMFVFFGLSFTLSLEKYIGASVIFYHKWLW